MKFFRLSLFFFVCITALQAQNFEPVTITQNLADPRYVETIDFNGDTLDDILVASSEGLYLFENIGAGQFSKKPLLDTLSLVFRFSVFDWGADGDLDIFYTTFDFPQKIAWLENDGNQNFSYHLITDTIASPFHIRPFDIDQDNDVDILVSSSATDELYWLKNDGTNNYSTIDTIGTVINHFEVADLNGDNDWDIIYGRPYTGITISEVRALQNDGTNTFSTITLKSGFSTIQEVFVEDINGDGFFDILVPDYNNDRISWLKNDGNYGFATQSNIIINFDGPAGIDIRDVNQDGKKDVIAGSYNADQIYYFQGQGSTSSYTFSSGTLLYSGLVNISDLAIGNFDNQNNLDFVHGDLGTDELSIWLNNGAQSFTQNRIAFSFDSPRAFDMQDLDGDGDDDFAAVSNDGDMVAWMENVGDDNFLTHILVTNYEESYAVRINDLDDDGDFDIIAASDLDDRVTWWKNDGFGNFVQIQIATNLNGPRDFWIEDFDGDGDKDIAVICYWLFSKSGITGAQLLTNDGNENFTISQIEDDIRAGRCIRAADLNGDSLVDLVISAYLYTGSELHLAINTGSGFSVMDIDDLLSEDIEVVDFDGDQDIDILALDFANDSLYLYENTGSLQFQRQTLGYFQDIYNMAPVDFDHDGDIDVVFSTGCNCFTNGSGFEWGLFRNNGSGSLSPEVWYQNLSLIRALEVFDYNQDGDVDVVVGYDFLDKITLYKNLDNDCYLNVSLSANGNTSFCDGDSIQLTAATLDTGCSYQWYKDNAPILNATTSQLTAYTSGLYTVAVSDTLCTSFSNGIQVFVGQPYADTIAMSFCENDSIVLDTLILKAPGTYVRTFMGVAGCDSTLTYMVTQNNTDSIFMSAAICSSDFYMFGGVPRTQAGLYTDTLVSQFGCDSVLYLDLAVNSVYSQNQTIALCAGDSALLPGGYWRASAGTYVDTLQTFTGCDSIWTTQVQVSPVFSTTDAATLCQGDSVLINGTYQTAAGIYVDTVLAVSGCDSIHSVAVTILQTALTTQNIEICQGDSFFAGGAIQTQSGVYYDTLQAANTCDSLVITNLLVLPNVQQTVSFTICQGDSVFAANAWQKTSGTYLDTLLAVTGCDSVVTTTLLVNPTFSIPQNATICQGDSIFLGGNWQTVSGTYTTLLTSTNQCDSSIVTTLFVQDVDTSVTENGVAFTANASAATYQWLDCNQGYAPIIGATAAVFVATTNGSYAVEVTQGGCVDTSKCYVVSTIGQAELQPKIDFSVYPNPTKGIIAIRGNFSTETKAIEITLYSMQGELLYRKGTLIEDGVLDTQLDMTDLPNGTYQLRLNAGGNYQSLPLIIAR